MSDSQANGTKIVRMRGGSIWLLAVLTRTLCADIDAPSLVGRAVPATATARVVLASVEPGSHQLGQGLSKHFERIGLRAKVTVSPVEEEIERSSPDLLVAVLSDSTQRPGEARTAAAQRPTRPHGGCAGRQRASEGDPTDGWV